MFSLRFLGHFQYFAKNMLNPRIVNKKSLKKQLDVGMDGQRDGKTDRGTDRQTGGWTNKQIVGRTEGRTDRQRDGQTDRRSVATCQALFMSNWFTLTMSVLQVLSVLQVSLPAKSTVRPTDLPLQGLPFLICISVMVCKFGVEHRNVAVTSAYWFFFKFLIWHSTRPRERSRRMNTQGS